MMAQAGSRREEVRPLELRRPIQIARILEQLSGLVVASRMAVEALAGAFLRTPADGAPANLGPVTFAERPESLEWGLRS